MEKSSALNQLLEAADLVAMVEDLIIARTRDGLSSSSASGIRLTLSNIRKNILDSHGSLASEYVSQARGEIARESAPQANNPSQEPAQQAVTSDPSRLNMKRRDLRASLERVVQS